jgi:hypothetical protein
MQEQAKNLPITFIAVDGDIAFTAISLQENKSRAPLPRHISGARKVEIVQHPGDASAELARLSLNAIERLFIMNKNKLCIWKRRHRRDLQLRDM